MRDNVRAFADASDTIRPVDARIRAAVSSGDVSRACRLLEAEIRRQPSRAPLRLQLASLREAAGDREAAALELTRLLRLAPGHVDAARRLNAILGQGRLADGAALEPSGLAACLAHRTVDRDLVGAAAVHYSMQNGTLRALVAALETHGAEATAGSILARRASPILRDELIVAVLSHCTVASVAVERLLTAVRREMLLSLPQERLSEPDLARFAVALASQCWSNEYVFGESDEEKHALAEALPPLDALLAGDSAAGTAYLRHALYRDSLRNLPADLAPEAVARISPRPFAVFLAERIKEVTEIRDRAKAIPRLGQVKNATSLKVKAQYEAHPYPRWQGTSLFPGGQFIEYLGSFFSQRQLAFANAPFEALVAGCGTGCQAVSAALDYGHQAKVTGLDISTASLGYAALMARRMNAANLSLALGDIGDVATFDPPWAGRFKVIECCGVLHHMADPFAAWRKLIGCLAPDGIMLVGLYSALARRDLETLRGEAAFPGAGCDDDALRAYRQQLFARGPDAPGAPYLRSRDAFTTSGFRDFFLHVSEQTTSLPDIARFLDDNGLVFRGFANVPFGALRQKYPDEVWPGRLERWAELEAERPLLFLGMYQFWITRR